MPEIDFGNSTEETLMVLRTLAQRMHDDLYNSGKDGLLTKFIKFTSDHDAKERERDHIIEQRHRENSTRLAEIANQLVSANLNVAKVSSQDARKTLIWTIAGVLVATMSLIGCGIAIMVAVKLAHSSSLPEILLHSAGPSLADTMSKLPYMR